MTPRPLALAFLIGVAGCGGCRGTKEQPPERAPAPPPADASPAPWSVVVVARAAGRIDLEPVANDGLVARSGILLYAVSASGGLTRIGAPPDYVPFLPEGDEELAGYDARIAFLGHVFVSGTAERPFVRVLPESVLGWDGHAWRKVADAPLPSDVRRHRWYLEQSDAGPSKEGLPPGYEWTDHMAESGERIAWLGMKETAGDTTVDVVAVAPAAGKEAQIVPFPSDDVGGARHRRCRFIDSADGRVYVRCSILPEGQGLERDGAVYRLAGDRLETLTAFTRDGPPHARPMILGIDAEGGAWVWGSTDANMTIERIGADGSTKRFDLPIASDDLGAPGYKAYEIPTRTVGAHGEGESYTRWTSANVVPAKPPSGPITVVDMVARRAGDVWIVALEPAGWSLLYRFARGATAPQPVFLRSMADEQNEIRNARGLRRWIGHCATVFVPFPKAASSDGGADAFYAARKAAIGAVVAKLHQRTKGHPDVAVVEGRLGERHAAGVLFIRSVPETSEDAMEAAATTVAEILTTDPTSPPDATCSVPVLERILHRYQPRYGTAVYEGE